MKYGFILLFLHFFSFQAIMFSQEHAIAYSMDPIEVDADLSDWPVNMTKYPVAILPFGEFSGKEDFQAFFQIGYNVDMQSLYLAVEVSDSEYISSNEEEDINLVDRMLIYIDPIHDRDGGASVIFETSEWYKDIGQKPRSWHSIPEDINWDNTLVKVKRAADKIVYEWAMTLEGFISANSVLGFDIIIVDQDANLNDQDWVLWNMGYEKSRSATRLGEVILAESIEQIGELKGHLELKDSTISQLHQVRISSTDNDKLWVKAMVDSLGNFEAELPESDYSVTVTREFSSELYFDGFNRDSRSLDIEEEVLVSIKAKKENYAKPLRVGIANAANKYLSDQGLLFNDEFDEDLLDKFVQQHKNYFNIPGVSLAVIKNGEVVYDKVFGLKNNLTEEVITKSSLFEAASITKSVFAMMTLRMVEKGLLDLDKPLYEYLSFPNLEHDERYKLITARHVLNHRTGLENWPVGSYTGNISDAKVDFLFDPGTGYHYSGEAINYLGRVVESICESSLTDIFNEEIAEKFGLTNTYFHYDKELESEMSLGHYQNMPFFKYKFDGVDSPASSLITNASDFSKFLLHLLRQEYLTDTSYKLISKPYQYFENKDRLYDKHLEQGIAYGYFVTETNKGSLIGHGGNNGDYDCKFAVMPSQNLGYVVFTNSNLGDEFIRALELFLLKSN